MSEIKSLKRALDILNLFSSEGPELGVSEIARKLDMNVSTVSRVLSTFTAQQLLVKSPTTQKYGLGRKILELAGMLLSQIDLRNIALPYMRELNEKTDETVGISVLEGDEAVCLERVESSQGIRRVINVGEYHAVHAGATGKCFLAYLSEEKRNKLIERTGLPQLTPQTITDWQMLEKELDKIRAQGVSVSFEERIPLSSSVAAPIMAYNDEIIAALTISGPVARFTYGEVQEYSSLVKEAAAKISRELGHRTSRRT